jgi:hypothetical protein
LKTDKTLKADLQSEPSGLPWQLDLQPQMKQAQAEEGVEVEHRPAVEVAVAVAAVAVGAAAEEEPLVGETGRQRKDRTTF